MWFRWQTHPPCAYQAVMLSTQGFLSVVFATQHNPSFSPQWFSCVACLLLTEQSLKSRQARLTSNPMCVNVSMCVCVCVSVCVYVFVCVCLHLGTRSVLFMFYGGFRPVACIMWWQRCAVCWNTAGISLSPPLKAPNGDLPGARAAWTSLRWPFLLRTLRQTRRGTTRPRDRQDKMAPWLSARLGNALQPCKLHPILIWAAGHHNLC